MLKIKNSEKQTPQRSSFSRQAQGPPRTREEPLHSCHLPPLAAVSAASAAAIRPLVWSTGEVRHVAWRLDA